jgi:N-methylhydantoinase A
MFGELIDQAGQVLAGEGVPPANMSFQRWLDLRYVGQEFTLQVPVSAEETAAADVEGIRRRFHEMHDRRYGQAAEDEPLELINLRLTAWGKSGELPLPAVRAEPSDALTGSRPVYLTDPRRPVDCAVYDRTKLGPGQTVTGPAVIEEHASTTLLFENDVAIIAETGEIVIKVGEAWQ